MSKVFKKIYKSNIALTLLIFPFTYFAWHFLYGTTEMPLLNSTLERRLICCLVISFMAVFIHKGTYASANVYTKDNN